MRAGHHHHATGSSRCIRTTLVSCFHHPVSCKTHHQDGPHHATTPDQHRHSHIARCSHQALASPPQSDSVQDEEAEAEDDEPLPSVVQIKVVKDLPRFDMPLLLGSVNSSTRSATAVRYKGQCYLITTASNVMYSTSIRVSLPGREQPFKAKVLHLAIEPDLAILEIQSQQSSPRSAPGRSGAGRLRGRGGRAAAATSSGGGASEAEGDDFWDCVTPLELGSLPGLQDVLQLSGASEGAPGGCITTSARVACVEVMNYPLASYRLLGVSLEGSVLAREHLGGAAVTAEGRCVGILFQSIKGSQKRRQRSGAASQVKAVPVNIIQHVLDDIQQHGTYMGFAQLGIRYKRMDPPALRQYAGMSAGQQGVMVLEVNPTTPVAEQLQVGDVIMQWQGRQVGNDGCMPFLNGDSIPITHWVTQAPVGSSAQVTVLRAGQPVELSVRLSVPHRLLPTHLSGAPPSYLVLGGLVFTTLSVPYLEQCFGAGGAWMRTAPPKLVALANTQPRDADEQVVVIAYCAGSAPGLDGYKPEMIEHQRVVGFHLSAGVTAATADNEHQSDAASGSAHGGQTRQGKRKQKSASPRNGPGNVLTLSQSAQGGIVAASQAEIVPAPGGPAGSQRLDNLRQLAAAVLGYRDGNIKLFLADGSVVVVGAAQAQADARALLAEFEVQAPVSQDLTDLLPKKATSVLSAARLR